MFLKLQNYNLQKKYLKYSQLILQLIIYQFYLKISLKIFRIKFQIINNLDESSSENNQQTLNFKIVLIGDSSVGKSSICNRFCKDMFAKQYQATLGIEFFYQRIQIQDNTVQFNLYDIGGTAINSSTLPMYLKSTDCILYVYDVTNLQSLNNLILWHQKLLEYNCTIKNNILIGNKEDLQGLNKIQDDKFTDINTLINPLKQFTVSALTGDHIQEMFIQIAGILTNKDLTDYSLETRQRIQWQIYQGDKQQPYQFQDQKETKKQTKSIQKVNQVNGTQLEEIQFYKNTATNKYNKKHKCFVM